MAIIDWVTVEREESLCEPWTAGERAGSYFTRPEWEIELLFVQACRPHNEQHGVSVRSTVSGHRSAVSVKTSPTGLQLRWVFERRNR